jgi:hypothetical protein
LKPVAVDEILGIFVALDDLFVGDLLTTSLGFQRIHFVLTEDVGVAPLVGGIIEHALYVFLGSALGAQYAVAVDVVVLASGSLLTAPSSNAVKLKQRSHWSNASMQRSQTEPAATSWMVPLMDL